MAPPKAGSVFVFSSVAMTLQELSIEYLRYDDSIFFDKRPHQNLSMWLERLEQANIRGPEVVLNYVRHPLLRIESLFNFLKLDSTGYPFWDDKYLVSTDDYLSQQSWLDCKSVSGTIHDEILYRNWVDLYVEQSFVRHMSQNQIEIRTFTLENISMLFSSFASILGVSPSIVKLSDNFNKDGDAISSPGLLKFDKNKFIKFKFSNQVSKNILKDFEKEFERYYSLGT